MFRLNTLLILSALICAGCASTIGNVNDITEVAFEVGGTNKSQVADALGFPEHRVVENEMNIGDTAANPLSQASSTLFRAAAMP